jgi:transcriptional regulator with XRE-family HTH domain
LGERLKKSRLARDDRQSDAAARLGVSLATYRKMEAGNPSVPMAYWLRMMRLYGNPEALKAVFDDKKSLFDQLEDEKRRQVAVRKRARRK